MQTDKQQGTRIEQGEISHDNEAVTRVAFVIVLCSLCQS
jgi:hypothetical protein